MGCWDQILPVLGAPTVPDSGIPQAGSTSYSTLRSAKVGGLGKEKVSFHGLRAGWLLMVCQQTWV